MDGMGEGRRRRGAREEERGESVGQGGRRGKSRRGGGGERRRVVGWGEGAELKQTRKKRCCQIFLWVVLIFEHRVLYGFWTSDKTKNDQTQSGSKMVPHGILRKDRS